MKFIHKGRSLLYLVIIILLIYLGWITHNVQEDIKEIQTQVRLIKQNDSSFIAPAINLSSKQMIVQDQISKIQDFEDRRYNAVTTQLNSFWSGVNGFLALVGIFFALFSWYLTKQVESATKNIDELENLKKDIDDYIADKSFELYERTIKQDVAQIIQAIKLSKNQEMIKSAYDIFKLRIKYIEMNDLIALYDSFNFNSRVLKQDKPSFYYTYLSYYLVLMLLKNYSEIPDGLVQELIHEFKTNHDLLCSSFILLNDICNTDVTIGKKLGNIVSKKTDLEELRTETLKEKPKYLREIDINDTFKRWFGYEV